VSNRRYAGRGKIIEMSSCRLYYDSAKLLSFSTLTNLVATVGENNKSDTRAWLGNQDAYTFHRPKRKRFARDPYTVNKVMDV